jgi:hypothetical protein
VNAIAGKAGNSRHQVPVTQPYDSQPKRSLFATLTREVEDNYVKFNVRDRPSLPLLGYEFLRFSSKLSSCSTTVIEAYIEGVFRIARSVFENRIKFWYEGIKIYGHYDWEEIINPSRAMMMTTNRREPVGSYIAYMMLTFSSRLPSESTQ